MPVLLAALFLAGCGISTDPPPPPMPEHAQRIICGTPAVAEIVFALGAGQRVVGVSDFTDWPPEAGGKPSIGGALAPNRERLLMLEPDLILSQGRAEDLARFAHRQGIAFQSLPLDTLDQLLDAIHTWGAALGVEDNGRMLLHEMNTLLASSAVREPVSVFIAIGHMPGDWSGLMTSGPGTFLHELVEKSGGRNIFSDAGLPWPTVSRESLVRRMPERILDIQPEPIDESRHAALLADWESLGFRGGQVTIWPDAHLLRPGPRAIRTIERLSIALRIP